MKSLKTLVLLICLSLIGCSSSGSVKNNQTLGHKTYDIKKEKLWVATVKALENYNMTAVNIEKGILEVDWENSLYTPPSALRGLASSTSLATPQRSRLLIQITEQLVEQRLVYGVAITKEQYLYNKTIGAMERVDSDGVEEGLLLVTIENNLRLMKEKSL